MRAASPDCRPLFGFGWPVDYRLSARNCLRFVGRCLFSLRGRRTAWSFSFDIGSLLRSFLGSVNLRRPAWESLIWRRSRSQWNRITPKYWRAIRWTKRAPRYTRGPQRWREWSLVRWNRARHSDRFLAQVLRPTPSSEYLTQSLGRPCSLLPAICMIRRDWAVYRVCPAQFR